MTNDLNSVNIETAERGGYHHGALRAALIAAAEEVIAERGVDGFSLRETARRAGVSPAAPGHHFKDARGLLTAVATGAYRDFGDALESAGAGLDRTGQIRAQGIAYVRFALAHRPRFDLMWRKALLDTDDPDLIAAGDRAFLVLDRVVRGDANDCDAREVDMAPSIAAWSMVHGFARLAMEGAFGPESDAAERAAEALLPHVLDHLKV